MRATWLASLLSPSTLVEEVQAPWFAAGVSETWSRAQATVVGGLGLSAALARALPSEKKVGAHWDGTGARVVMGGVQGWPPVASLMGQKRFVVARTCQSVGLGAESPRDSPTLPCWAEPTGKAFIGTARMEAAIRKARARLGTTRLADIGGAPGAWR